MGCLAASAAVFTSSSPAAQGPTDADRTAEISAMLNDRAQVVDEKTLTRSLERSPTAAAPATPAPAPAASPSPTPSPAKTVKGPPVPVASLVQAQMNNAATIVEVGQLLGLPRKALIIGVATAMQESNLYNLASTALPESYDYPHEGEGSDHDSVGIFQQRPSAGWGTVAECMRPAYAAQAFFERLMQLDWPNMALTQAAQAVQVSAFPDAYAKHEDRATTIVDALL